MAKKKTKLMALLLTLVMVCTLLPMSVLAADSDPAAATQVTDAAGLIDAVNAGGTITLGDKITLTDTLTVSKDCTIDVNGNTLSINPAAGKDGINLSNSATGTAYKLTLKDSTGSGSIAIDGGKRGIYILANNCSIDLKNIALSIKNTPYCGIYAQADNAGFTMTGGSLTIQDCANGNGEGGFLWNSGEVTFNSGAVNISNCGYSSFGPFYVQAPVIFGDGGPAPLTVKLGIPSKTTGKLNALVLAGNGSPAGSLTINKNATVDLDLSSSSEALTEVRGVNGAGSNDLVVNGGILNITHTGNAPANLFAIRNCSTTIENGGKLNIIGTKTGFEKGTLSVYGASTVSVSTLDGGMDSTASPNAITGGSVKMDDGFSITNGIKSNCSDKVTSTPVNDHNVGLSRFDLAGVASERTIAIPLPTEGVYTYDYEIAANSNSTDYVWAPEVAVNFYKDKASAVAGGEAGYIDTRYTILGNSLDTVNASAPAYTAPSGMVVDSWYMIAASTVEVASLTTESETDTPWTSADKVNFEINVYPTWKTAPVSPVDPPVDIPDPEVPKGELPTDLNSTDHFAYIKGYPDGTVQPNGKITRAEVTTAFYRLLTSERRDSIFTDSKASYNDVTASQWFNKAVASMSAGEYVNGYPDGSFGANKNITRAEFVAIAARFMNAKSGPVTFTDVSADHWAYNYISTAVAYGWIDGYPDGSFKPNQPITRAEAMKIINTMLARGVDKDGVIAGIVAWPDNAAGTWYYYDVVEATNSHLYSDSRPSEKWTSLETAYTYDMAKYERP